MKTVRLKEFAWTFFLYSPKEEELFTKHYLKIPKGSVGLCVGNGAIVLQSKGETLARAVAHEVSHLADNIFELHLSPDNAPTLKESSEVRAYLTGWLTEQYLLYLTKSGYDVLDKPKKG